MTRTTTAEPRARRRDAAENHAAILAAARVVLARDPDASLDEVATAAGLSRRSFYGHFASRDALRSEIARAGALRISDAIADIVGSDSRVVIALIAARLWREVGDVLLLTQRTVHGPRLDELAEPLTPVRSLLLRTVERGIGSGDLRQDMPAPTLARLIEASAIAVLDEAATTSLSPNEGRLLVMRSVLATAGLSWRETDDLILATPDLNDGAH